MIAYKLESINLPLTHYLSIHEHLHGVGVARSQYGLLVWQIWMYKI